jgi:acyl-CoA thioesterase
MSNRIENMVSPSPPYSDGTTVRPCPFRAQAWWGDELVADSTSALLVDASDGEPTLWFPWEAVRTDAFRSAGREPWRDGEIERFDAAGRMPERREPVTWRNEPDARRAGAGVVRRCSTPPPGLEVLRDHAMVDHAQARVEIIDAVEGDEPRDVTVKRFPIWGDASDLIAVLDRGVVVHDSHRPVVEGSQLLGQTIVAAMRQTSDRRVISAHMVFLRAADANEPVDIALDALASGRTFTAFTARAEQRGRLCASGTLLLGVPAIGVVEHAEDSSGITGPYDAVPYDMGVTGRDVRVVEAAYTDDPDAPVGPPSIDAWVRFRHVPDDPALHAGLLAQFSGHMSIAAALRPHAGIGQREAHRTISTAINAIAISFHADVRMDRWILYRHIATVVADGMAHTECRVHGETGALVASFSVDAMIRPLERSGADARTAL